MRNSSKFLIFFIFFIPVWLFISWLGNWEELAVLYETQINVDHQIKDGSISIKYVDNSSKSISNGVHIGVTDMGIIVEPIFVFSFANPPLLFPWESIQQCNKVEDWVELVLNDTNISVSINDEDGLIINKCLLVEAEPNKLIKLTPGGAAH